MNGAEADMNRGSEDRERCMSTRRLVRFIAVDIILLLAISIGGYFLHRALVTSSQNAADTKTIYQVVGEFGARLKDVPDSSQQSLATQVAQKGIGVRVVKGIRVFHMEDGQDLKIDKMPNGEEVIGVNEYEALPLKDVLEQQTGIVRDAMYLRTATAVNLNLKRFITDRLYKEFTTYADVVPGKPISGPYPDGIRIDSLQKLDDTSYTVKGQIILMTSTQITQSGNSGEAPITLTLKKVSNSWLIEDVAQSLSR
jgi:hypothetical protein